MRLNNLHFAGRLEVFMATPPHKPYEAQITHGDVQYQGYGSTPREAIIDALSDDSAESER